MDEAPRHPHNRARDTFIEVDGTIQPAPAPRFSRTPPAPPTPPVVDGDSRAALADWGFTAKELDHLGAAGAL